MEWWRSGMWCSSVWALQCRGNLCLLRHSIMVLLHGRVFAMHPRYNEQITSIHLESIPYYMHQATHDRIA